MNLNTKTYVELDERALRLLSSKLSNYLSGPVDQNWMFRFDDVAALTLWITESFNLEKRSCRLRLTRHQQTIMQRVLAPEMPRKMNKKFFKW